MGTDYLIVGSGLSALVFGALMAKAGKQVLILEAHEYPGGFGHTFSMGKYHRFNAQLHYVWNCGEGQTVNRILRKLELEKDVTFEPFDRNGFDHMRMPGYALDIPADSQQLSDRLCQLFPGHMKQIAGFLREVERTASGLGVLSSHQPFNEVFGHVGDTLSSLRNLNCTLQDVFDRHGLPLEAQTLLALQWPDFMLPPDQLAFYSWVLLFTGYQEGAWYPTKHFEHVVDSLVTTIKSADGEIMYGQQVDKFVLAGNRVVGVEACDLQTGESIRYEGSHTICNMDPQKAAGIIGLEKFSSGIRKRLDYPYSYSNFIAYCTVKDIDLEEYGFGRWNIFHASSSDLNAAINKMYVHHDYSEPSFAISTPGFLTDDISDRPQGQQIVELLTIADYDYFKQLKETDGKAYKRKKKEILNAMLDQIEANYVPDFRAHIAFKITGSPTTNEDYCWCPRGNSYGSSMTPAYFGLGRLTHQSSLENFHFCNASSGYPGFAGTFWTGAKLYQTLTDDKVF
ncbi:MAG: FAD-dependent oxidoreductase [Gammaproteobacteria bacterium]|nr:FAD-dependent oxidoreductase [Gammaproteobacteria bacterium]